MLLVADDSCLWFELMVFMNTYEDIKHSTYECPRNTVTCISFEIVIFVFLNIFPLYIIYLCYIFLKVCINNCILHIGI